MSADIPDRASVTSESTELDLGRASRFRVSADTSGAEAQEIACLQLQRHVVSAAAAEDRAEPGDGLIDKHERALDGERHDAAKLHAELRGDIGGIGGPEIGTTDAQRVRD